MCLALALRDSIASLGLLDDLFGYFPVDEGGMGASVVTPRFTLDSDFIHHTICTVHTRSVHFFFLLKLILCYLLIWIHHHLCLILLIKPLQHETPPLGCLGPNEHDHRSTRASRSTAHNQCSTLAGRPRAHQHTLPQAAVQLKKLPSCDDSPLSSASPDVVRLSQWDVLGWCWRLNHNPMHKLPISSPT
jgi:hypothetical protein